MKEPDPGYNHVNTKTKIHRKPSLGEGGTPYDGLYGDTPPDGYILAPGMGMGSLFQGGGI